MPANVMLVKWSGGWREVTSAALLETGPRKEMLLGLGAVQSAAEVDRVAFHQIELFGVPRENIAADVDPSTDANTPYVGFGVGDIVTVPNQKLEPVQERCISITVSEDEDGNVTYAPEFRDIILDAQEQFEQSIKSMSDGTVRGQSKVATPIASISNPGPDCCPPVPPPPIET